VVGQNAAPYSVLLDSVHGPLILPRHDRHQPLHLLRTGRPHIQHEIETLQQIIGLLAPGPLVLDIGANAGLIAIPLGWALGDRGGVVHAFEAQRLVYYMFAGNVALNGLVNVHCHHAALSDRAEVLRIDRKSVV
jgi:precorrin-6B methylase 2